VENNTLLFWPTIPPKPEEKTLQAAHPIIIIKLYGILKNMSIDP
jgi:hypothetical protein